MAMFKRFLAAATFATALLAASSHVSAQTSKIISVSPGSRVPHPGVLTWLAGRSLEINESRLILGAIGPEAIVYEDSPPGSGNWTLMQAFVDATPWTSLDDGMSVAISGNLAVVGSPWDFDYDGEGATTLYSFDGSSWNIDLQTRGNPAALIGISSGLSGNTAILGSLYGCTIYEFDGMQWNRTFSSTVPTDYSDAVAISGDVAVAATYFGQNQAVVYRRVAGVWGKDQTIVSMGSPELISSGIIIHGVRVALDGETLLVKALKPLPVSGFQAGVAVFEDQGTEFVYQQFVEAQDGANTFEQFAFDFDISGDRIVIGAYKDLPRGSAYVFKRDTTNGLFAEEAKYVPTGGEFTNFFGTPFPPDFGYSVDISADYVVIGAQRNDGSGTAYVLPLGDFQGGSAYQSFCFGNGGIIAGCTDCPCSNNADTGVVGGCLNSNGTSAVLSILGEASATNDTTRLELARAKPGVLTLLASGESMLPMNPGASPCPRGSGIRSAFFDGLRCIGGPIVRHGTRMTDATGAVEGDTGGWGGQFAPTQGLVAQGGFAIGQQRFFQAIYRDDPMLGCGTGLNTSNAVAIQVVP